jgi:hypothetical protein
MHGPTCIFWANLIPFSLQSLTILIPLSDPEAFGGGGTAFWAAADCVGGGVGSSPPALVLAPPAGTAILFGGSVTHAGQPTTAGESSHRRWSH